jgi:putative transposase
MKQPTPTQIVKLLRAADAALGQGQTVEVFCRAHHISCATYYRWRQHYGGLAVPAAKRLKQLETENTRLKKMVAEVLLANDTLQAYLAKKK